jgi:hypothetical protein
VLSDEFSQSQVTHIPETQLSAPAQQDGKHFGSAVRHESKSRSVPSPHGHVSMITLIACLSATDTDETQPNDYSSGDPNARPAAAEKKRSATGKRAAAADKPATEYVFECKLLLQKATLLLCFLYKALASSDMDVKKCHSLLFVYTVCTPANGPGHRVQKWRLTLRMWLVAVRSP